MANGIAYFVTKTNEQQRIDIVLEDSVKALRTHYEMLQYSQDLIAKTAYISTMKLKNVVEIIKEANIADEKEKKLLRNKLQILLDKKYEILKMKGVLQYHFLLPNNESFLKGHS